MDASLKPVLQTRKLEIANIIDIISLISASPLNASMTPAQQSASLKDKLNILSSDGSLNTSRVTALAANVLAAVNSLTGTSFTMADIDSGTVTSGALKDAIEDVLTNNKMIVYGKISMPGVVAAPTGLVGAASILPFADGSDWSISRFGGLGAPYNSANPVPVSAAFSEKTRVDALHVGTGDPVLNGGNKVVGFVSGFNAGTNEIQVTWGYINSTDHNFYAANFPATVTTAVDLVLPVKTNFGAVPVEFLGMAKGGIAGGSGAADAVLTQNGITSTSDLDAMLGLPTLTVSAFAAATNDPSLNPGGYTSLIHAILDLLSQIDATRSWARGLFDNINTFVGKADLEATPSYGLLGDARDFVTQGASLESALTSVHAALNKGNVLTVASSGANYMTIGAALADLVAGTFGVLSASNPFVVVVAPGTFAENLLLEDFVHIIGSGIDATIINGVVELPNRAGTSTGIRGKVSNLTITSGAAATMLVSADDNHTLRALKIVNTGGGVALKIEPDSFADVILAPDVTLESSLGLALDVTMARVSAYGYISGNNGASMHSGSALHMRGAEIVCTNDGVVVDNSSMLDMLFGNISASNRGVVSVGGVLALDGGWVLGSNYSVVADSSSTVYIGAINIDASTISWAGATKMPDMLARGAFVEDATGNFFADNVEDVLGEVGGSLVMHQNEINTLHGKSNFNEQDAVVDMAMIQLSLMPADYSVFMVDSFMDQVTNVYPDGADKALIIADHSVLIHQGSSETYNYYKQNFDSGMAGKTRVYVKASVQKGFDDASGNHDWQIEYRLEISGGRYGGTPLTYSLHTTDAANLGAGRLEKELMLNLLSPIAGSALTPLIGTGEVVSLKIVIKKDSATPTATPAIRSVVVFM